MVTETSDDVCVCQSLRPRELKMPSTDSETEKMPAAIKQNFDFIGGRVLPDDFENAGRFVSSKHWRLLFVKSPGEHEGASSLCKRIPPSRPGIWPGPLHDRFPSPAAAGPSHSVASP